MLLGMPNRGPTIERPTAPRGTRVLSTAAALVGWLAFVWMWARSIALSTPTQLEVIGWFVLSSIVVVSVVTIGWRLHNVRLHRRLPPRTAVTRAELVIDRDFVGRQLVGDRDEMGAAPVVVVAVDGDRKLYVPASTPAPIPAPTSAARPTGAGPSPTGEPQAVGA